MPEPTRIKATYYQREPHAHPRRTDWYRVASVVLSALAVTATVYILIVLFALTFGANPE